MPGIINKVRLINMIAGPARLSLSFREREGKVGAMRGEGDAGMEARLARGARREKESWRDTFREKRRSRWSSSGPNRPTTRALATRRMGISRLCGTSARVAASPMVSEGFKSPYREEHVRVLQRFVHGFEAYATARRTLDTFDIVLWAVLCGAFKLAKTLWLRKDCESPLRLSLLVQHMCHRIRLKEKRRINELLETEGFFRSNAIQLLDNLPDQETARKLLLSTSSPKAALGARDRSLCLLDLAIDLRNVQFISHRYCQASFQLLPPYPIPLFPLPLPPPSSPPSPVLPLPPPPTPSLLYMEDNGREEGRGAEGGRGCVGVCEHSSDNSFSLLPGVEGGDGVMEEGMRRESGVPGGREV